MSNWFTFEIWQDGISVASVSAANRDIAMGEAMHYLKVYRRDGAVELRENVGRKRITISTLTRMEEG
jgi:hypothetical protein